MKAAPGAAYANDGGEAAPVNLTTVLERQARERPNQPALVHGHGRRERMITFGELEREVRLATAGWMASGLPPGSAVLIFHPLSVELYVALLGLMRAGLIAVFVDPTAGLGQLRHACGRSQPRAVLVNATTRLIAIILPALRSAGPVLTPDQLLRLGSGCSQAPADLPITTAASPALITWTSGSTGQPKGIVRSHGFLLQQHAMLERYLRLKPGEVDLTALPVFALANLASGLTSVLLPGKAGRPAEADPRLLARQISRWSITRSAGSPALYQRLLAAPEAVRALRQLYLGGAPVFPRLLRKLEQLNPHLELTCVYGSTEAEPIAEHCWSGAGELAQGHGLYQGLPVPEAQVAILPDSRGPLEPFTVESFAQARLQPGEPGEIVVSGPHVIQGYLGGIGDAETKFKVGDTIWHRTGDAGYLDAAGGLWLLGRCSALAPRSQSAPVRQARDYPFAVEVAAMELPGVERAALLEHVGKRLLFIQVSPGTKPDEVVSRVNQDLAWAQLTQVRPLSRIPLDRRHQAKVDYPRLRQIARH